MVKKPTYIALNSQRTRGSEAAPGQVLKHTLFQAMSNIFQFGIFCTSRISFNSIVIMRSHNSYNSTVTFSKCQISLTYSSIVLSDVNLPTFATLSIADFAQPSASL